MPTSTHRRDWEDLSELDPLWAILSDPSRQYGRWELDEFLARGREEVAEVLAGAEAFGLPARRGTALDFGCGAGRLTLALAAHFEACVGVDISAPMVEQARALAEQTGAAGCEFVVNDAPDLRRFDDARFDLVLSRIVLQHIPEPAAKLGYITELTRVLAPGGLLHFQVPSRIALRRRLQPRPRAYGLLRGLGVPAETLYRRLRLNPIRMTALPVAPVSAAIERAGGRVLRVDTDPTASGESASYWVTRAA